MKGFAQVLADCQRRNNKKSSSRGNKRLYSDSQSCQYGNAMHRMWKIVVYSKTERLSTTIGKLKQWHFQLHTVSAITEQGNFSI